MCLTSIQHSVGSLRHMERNLDLRRRLSRARTPSPDRVTRALFASVTAPTAVALRLAAPTHLMSKRATQSSSDGAYCSQEHENETEPTHAQMQHFVDRAAGARWERRGEDCAAIRRGTVSKRPEEGTLTGLVHSS